MEEVGSEEFPILIHDPERQEQSMAEEAHGSHTGESVEVLGLLSPELQKLVSVKWLIDKTN